MKRLTEKEANQILTKLVGLRNKCKHSKNKQLHHDYLKYEAFCGQQFDYLVVSKVQRYRKFANYDDLKQDGRIALLMALRNFEPTKGSFFWWANQYINTKVKREANRHSTMKIPMKHAKKTQPYKVSQLPILIDSGPSALEIIENNELKSQVVAAINKLPDEQKKILELNGIKSYSISQISKELKIARMECIKILNEARKNLKTSLENLT